MKHYDIILIFSGMQRNCIYFDIISKLKDKKKILIIPLKYTFSQKKRAVKSSNLFLEKCKDLGAEISKEKNFTCDLLILGQQTFNRNDIINLKLKIKSKKIAWLAGVAMGNAFFEYLYDLKIDYILVPDKNFYNYRIKEFSDDGVVFPKKKIIEIGMTKVNIFKDDFKDKDYNYLIAHPSPFSFSNDREIFKYYLRLYILVLRLNEKKKNIIIKNHNADERNNYMISKYYNFFFKYLCNQKFFEKYINPITIKMNKKKFDNFFSNMLYKLSVCYLDKEINSKCLFLSKITKYHNFNLELFLPYIKDGLITGRSNSIWQSLLISLPVLNLIDKKTPYRYPNKMHAYSMKYFDVHFDDFKFNKSNFKKISQSCRDANISKVVNDICSKL